MGPFNIKDSSLLDPELVLFPVESSHHVLQKAECLLPLATLLASADSRIEGESVGQDLLSGHV